MNKTTLANLGSQLIRFRTVTNDSREQKKAVDFILKYCNGLPYKKYSKNGSTSLLITNSSLNTIYDVILHGHIDVVPTLSKDRFKPYIKGNRLYGRGALDMKGGVAVLIQFLKDVSKEKINKKIAVLITTDEEVGGENGSKYIFEKTRLKGRFFITAEGEKDWLIKHEQKGVLMLQFTAKTGGGHAAYTWNTENAIDSLYSFINELKKLFPPNLKDKEHWYTTLNVGVIQGGQAPNSVPSEATAKIDIRYCNNWKKSKEILKKIDQILKKHKNISYTILHETPMMYTDSKNKDLIKLHQITKKVTGKKTNLLFKNPGTNDARFANAAGIPSVGFGPIGDNYHAEDEYVNIHSLVQFYQILREFAIST